jgi:hypothetical protein
MIACDHLQKSRGEDADPAGVEGIGAVKISAARLFIIFAFLGPPLGLLTLIFMSIVRDLYYENFQNLLPPGGLTAVGLLIVVSYAFGIVPAVISGLGVFWIRRKQFRNEALYVVLVGTAVGITYVLCVLLLTDQFYLHLMPAGKILPMIGTCLGPTLVCWAIVHWSEARAGHVKSVC